MALRESATARTLGPPTDTLWTRYRQDHDPQARADLLARYLGLVHHLARELGSRTGNEVEVDDLVSAGSFGLLRALDGFDPARGLAFSTYAVPRIRGAILDELRARDWMPRTIRARARDLARARGTLEQGLGRRAQAAEMAECLGVDVATFWRWEEQTVARELVSIDQPHLSTVPGTGANCLLAAVADEQAESARQEGIDAVREALGELPERDRTVLTLYYYEALNLRQIGEILHVSESRVSQIRSRALGRLRERLGGPGRASPREATGSGRLRSPRIVVLSKA